MKNIVMVEFAGCAAGAFAMNMEFATAAQVQEGFGTGLTAMLIAVSVMAIAAYAGGHLATPLRLRWWQVRTGPVPGRGHGVCQHRGRSCNCR